MTTYVSDEALWREALAGSEQAFAEVFDRHVDRVFTHCVRRVESRTDAEDLTAVVFLESWRQARRVRFVDGSALPWLLVVATNVSRTHTRAARRYEKYVRRLPHAQNEPDVSDDAIANIDLEQRAAQVRRCVAKLNVKHQEIVSLCDYGGLNYAAAAEVLNIPIGTVRSRLSRAHEQLRNMLSAPGSEHLATVGLPASRHDHEE